jgi:hypothetical protein
LKIHCFFLEVKKAMTVKMPVAEMIIIGHFECAFAITSSAGRHLS